jgi:hypothetical protein
LSAVNAVVMIATTSDDTIRTESIFLLVVVTEEALKRMDKAASSQLAFRASCGLLLMITAIDDCLNMRKARRVGCSVDVVMQINAASDRVEG